MNPLLPHGRVRRFQRATLIQPLVLVLALAVLALSGCQFVSPPAPSTPNAVATLQSTADQLLASGLQKLEQGQYREALNDLEQARLYSPQPDARIDAAIERARAALNPSPTATITPTPTVTPTPRPVVCISTQQPDEALADAYFGTTYLTVVPGELERLDPATGRRVQVLPPPMTVFWTEYQIGLYVERLGQTLRQPFTLRIFDLVTGCLVAEASTETPLAAPTAAPPRTQADPLATAPTQVPATTPRTLGATPAPGAQVKRWFDRFVWYKEGGEAPGRYRLELYAGAQLARVIDYEVRAEFVPLPTSTPTPLPTDTPAPTATPTPLTTPAPGTPGVPGVPAAPGAPAAAPATAAPTPTTTATPTPTPAVASVATTGGLPAAITFNAAGSQLFVADASGVIWMVDQDGPTLKQPFVLEASPVDAVMDPLTGRLYVGLKGTGAQSSVAVLNGSTGERVATVSIANGQVTELVVNPATGMLYALIPSIEQLTIIDLRTNALQQSVKYGPLAQVTGMALGANGSRLYMSDLAGNLLIFDARDPRSVQQMRVSGSGLAGLATAGDRVFVINTPGKRVHVVDPAAQQVLREIELDQEPGAIAAGVEDGMLYVLGTQRPAIIRVDPDRGAVNGLAFLPARSGLMNLQAGGARDLTALRSRLAINPFDGSIFVAQPEIGTVSVVTPDKFPPIEAGR